MTHCLWRIFGLPLLVGTASLLIPVQCAKGAILVDFQTSSASQTAFPISQADLINLGQATLSSELKSGYTASPIDSYGPITAINDGELGGDTGFVPSPGGVMDLDGVWSVVFNLDTGLMPDGYAIGSIETFTGHRDNRKSQNYEVFVSSVGDSEFTSLGHFEFNYDTPDPGSTRLRIFSDTGVLATNVDAIRFDVLMPSSGFATVYREFDVYQATVPEPTSFVAFGLGFACILGGKLVKRCWSRQRKSNAIPSLRSSHQNGL